MKTHNAIIYHCLDCGHLVHREPELEHPWCCGKKMVKAAAETILGDEQTTAATPPGGPCETPLPAPNIAPKPR